MTKRESGKSERLSLLESKIRKIIKEEMNSRDILFYVTKTRDIEGPTSLFSLEFRTPNSMPLKFVHQIPNPVAMKMENELELAIKAIFDKYKKR